MISPGISPPEKLTIFKVDVLFLNASKIAIPRRIGHYQYEISIMHKKVKKGKSPYSSYLRHWNLRIPPKTEKKY